MFELNPILPSTKIVSEGSLGVGFVAGSDINVGGLAAGLGFTVAGLAAGLATGLGFHSGIELGVNNFVLVGVWRVNAPLLHLDQPL